MSKSALSGMYRFCLAFVLALCSVVLSIGSVSADPTKVVTYYHNNLQGSPFAASYENGKLWEEQYSPYGYRVGGTGGRDAKALNEMGYTGHVEEKYLPNQLIYAKGRFYDPTLGRFLSMDAIDFLDGNPQSFNRYSYANNNPYKYIDPDGNLFFLAYPLGIIALATLDIAIGVALDNNDSYQNGQLARVDFLPGPVSGVVATGAIAGKAAGRAAASNGLTRTVDSISVSEIVAINKRFSDGVPILGKDVSTVLANAYRREGPLNQAASAIRDIAGGHLFTNGNKRTAQALVESLNLPGVSTSQIRNVIDQVGEGALREVDDIAKALSGG